MAEYTIELGKLITLAGFDIGLNDYPLPEFLKSAGDRESWRKALNQKSSTITSSMKSAVYRPTVSRCF